MSLVTLIFFTVVTPLEAVSLTSFQNTAHVIFCSVNSLFRSDVCIDKEEVAQPQPIKAIKSKPEAFVPTDRENTTKEQPTPSVVSRQATIINQITNPIVERIIHTREMLTQPEITRVEFNTLRQLIEEANNTSAPIKTNYTYDDSALWRALSHTQRIDTLSNVELSNSTITNSPISGSTGSFTTLAADAFTVSTFLIHSTAGQSAPLLDIQDSNDVSFLTVASSGAVTLANLSGGGVVQAASGTGLLSVGTLGASDIVNVPSGDIASTNVQSVINELDTEKLSVANNLSDVANASTSRDNLGLGTGDSPFFAGLTANGTVHIENSAGLNIDGASSTDRLINFQTSNVGRFALGLSDGAESGSDAGSNLLIHRYNDAGVWQDVSFSIKRSTGNVAVGRSDGSSKLHIYENTGNTGSNTGLKIEQDGTGDAITQWILTGGTHWVAGIDNSDGDKWKLSPSADVGVNPAITVDPVTLRTGFGTSPVAQVHIHGDGNRGGLYLDGGNTDTAMPISIHSDSDYDWSVNSIYSDINNGDALTLQGKWNGDSTNILLNPFGSGNVGIGTTLPTEKLHIHDATSPTIRLSGDGDNALNSGKIEFSEGTSPAQFNITHNGDANILSISTSLVDNAFIIARDTGNIGIGITNSSQKLAVYNGSTTGTYTTSGWVHSSDRNLKTNIVEIQNPLDIISNLSGVTFNWKADENNNQQIGFIAQDVKEFLPQVVVGDEESGYGISYGNITGLNLSGIKELWEKVQELFIWKDEKDSKITELEQRIEELEHLVGVTVSRAQDTPAPKEVVDNDPIILSEENPDDPIINEADSDDIDGDKDTKEEDSDDDAPKNEVSDSADDKSIDDGEDVVDGASTAEQVQDEEPPLEDVGAGDTPDDTPIESVAEPSTVI